MSEKLSRRATFGAIGGVAVATLSLGSLATGATHDDPIFAALDAVLRADKASTDADVAFTSMEEAAEEQAGERRPLDYVRWRSLAVDADQSALDYRRGLFLCEAKTRGEVGDFTIANIEAEYIELQKEAKSARAANAEWDRRHGLADIRASRDRLNDERVLAVGRLAETIPTTVSGCAAVMASIQTDLDIGLADWHLVALANVTKALQRFSAT